MTRLRSSICAFIDQAREFLKSTSNKEMPNIAEIQRKHDPAVEPSRRDAAHNYDATYDRARTLYLTVLITGADIEETL